MDNQNLYRTSHIKSIVPDPILSVLVWFWLFILPEAKQRGG